MKTQAKTTFNKPIIAAFALMLGCAALDAGAMEKTAVADGGQLIYQSHFANHAIQSYPASIPGEAAPKPELIYVNRAFGPAIHSYLHAGNETAVPWNVEYVDTAYGQAIYSYESVQPKGSVELLPIVVY